MTTPMLRSYAMVQETHVTMRYKRSLSHRGRAETTRDDGSGEEHSDTCCRGGCKRMAIWFRDATHGYCTPHWKDYIRNRQATTDALENGLCVQCKKVEAVKCSMCAECLESHRERHSRRERQNRAEGKCWCGRTPINGKATCEACIAGLTRREKRKKAKGLCGCGEKRFGALSCCYGCWMIQLRAKDKREEAQRQAMDSWEDSMLEGLE